MASFFKGKVFFLVLLAAFFPTILTAETSTDQKIKLLELQVTQLTEQLEAIKQDIEAGKNNTVQQSTQIDQLRSQISDINESTNYDLFNGSSNFRFGGYGEIHANFKDDSESDILDFHRLVLYLGYDFTDWISFNSEWELEHSFVSDDSGGYFLIEQAYFDFLLSDSFNIRAGKILTPLGITNKIHEPTLFNGVERPSFDKYIIPTTWSSDGVGIFGQISPSLTYEAYVVGGLDGSKFTETSGIRKGRIKERASLNDLTYTGRLDYYPTLQKGQDLRIGLSGYFGGLDNGNNGSTPGIDSKISIYSTDFEYSVNKFDFRGALAHTFLENSEQLGAAGQDIAEETFGWYLEAGYHFWPEDWKNGKLKNSDAVLFVRYDDFDTQYKMPSGVAANPAADRTEWTVGLNFYLTPNLVIKADYQMPDDESGNKLNNKFNIGLGWTF